MRALEANSAAHIRACQGELEQYREEAGRRMAELKQAETHIEELQTQMQRERIAQQEVLAAAAAEQTLKMVQEVAVARVAAQRAANLALDEARSSWQAELQASQHEVEEARAAADQSRAAAADTERKMQQQLADAAETTSRLTDQLKERHAAAIEDLKREQEAQIQALALQHEKRVSELEAAHGAHVRRLGESSGRHTGDMQAMIDRINQRATQFEVRCASAVEECAELRRQLYEAQQRTIDAYQDRGHLLRDFEQMLKRQKNTRARLGVHQKRHTRSSTHKRHQSPEPNKDAKLHALEKKLADREAVQRAKLRRKFALTLVQKEEEWEAHHAEMEKQLDASKQQVASMHAQLAAVFRILDTFQHRNANTSRSVGTPTQDVGLVQRVQELLQSLEAHVDNDPADVAVPSQAQSLSQKSESDASGSEAAMGQQVPMVDVSVADIVGDLAEAAGEKIEVHDPDNVLGDGHRRLSVDRQTWRHEVLNQIAPPGGQPSQNSSTGRSAQHHHVHVHHYHHSDQDHRGKSGTEPERGRDYDGLTRDITRICG